MHVTYLKLLLIEGLICQVRAEEDRCTHTLKMRDKLNKVGELINEINTYFEEGDPLEGIEGLNNPRPEEEEDEDANLANAILEELEKIKWDA
jgi:hypothetical protein